MPVCPLCNGLASVQRICPRCGRTMVDTGLLQDYYDNYSAYLEQNIYEDGYRCYDHATCVHLFACPCCHYDINVSFKKLNGEFLLNNSPE
ncbi:MAG TPA: hypothetical protein PL078_05645 [Bacillota bacterium]|nr:hypothetical protein [Peptococcaceae bacterium]HPU35250.1 hypothetical protein [Bacillota bacterium]HPZ43470.1 hypothetical protein [Bacillota bacterium]HQD76870.1 hypothetical protein [Bacillota bacterium]HUM58627.1 hypothetical protein [Bacillota bacterium]